MPDIGRAWRRHFPPEYDMPLAAAVLRAPGVLAEWYIRPHRLARHVTYVSGPLRIDADRQDVVLLSVVRNASLHIDRFISHHLRLGVRHIVLLDNGSTDDTIARAAACDRVTVLQTLLPYRHYEVVMKRYLVHRFARDRWHLFADADERFEYPLAGRVPLSALIDYLDRGGYQALVAQMLDLFPDTTLLDLPDTDDFERTHVFYDLTPIETSPYIWGAVAGSGVQMHWGGIRRRMFGTRLGLTKVALARASDDVELFVGWHHTRYARVANLTGLLRHYPFAGPFTARIHEAVRSRRYGPSAGREYRRYWRVLRSDPQQRLRSATASEWTGIDPLAAQGFVIVPDDYARWASARDAS